MQKSHSKVETKVLKRSMFCGVWHFLYPGCTAQHSWISEKAKICTWSIIQSTRICGNDKTRHRFVSVIRFPNAWVSQVPASPPAKQNAIYAGFLNSSNIINTCVCHGKESKSNYNNEKVNKKKKGKEEEYYRKRNRKVLFDFYRSAPFRSSMSIHTYRLYYVLCIMYCILYNVHICT